MGQQLATQPPAKPITTRKNGRPTNYSPKILTKTTHYIDNYTDYGHKIPSIAGLALYLNTTRERLYQWAKRPEATMFRDMLQVLKHRQEEVLLSNGLDGVFNPTITKLVLSKHGYHDRPEGERGVSITVNVNRDVVEVNGEIIDNE